MRIAVVGSGITGLSAAWLLSKNFDVVLFEADTRAGGHSNTVDVETPDGVCPVDTGFIVYNAASYPNLVALFDHLKVASDPTDMSFAVSVGEGHYEYSGTGLNGLFAQRSNILNPRHWLLLKEAMRFFREAQAFAEAGADDRTSLGKWLNDRGYARPFIDDHILPMGAAIWSTPTGDMLDFPAISFMRFFSNHGLLQAFRRPIWRTVRGGSRNYVAKILRDFRGRLALGEAVQSISASAGKTTVVTGAGHSGEFDAVILACHADDALRLYSHADAETRALLSSFRYARNTAVLHSDAGLMPRRRRAWSSWNYLAPRQARSEGHDTQITRVSVTYWMNSLQQLATSRDWFVTLNPYRQPANGSVAGSFAYQHPMFDVASLAAQKQLWRVQGRGGVWLAGSYCGSGFHEDGLQAGLWAAEDLSLSLGRSVERPWALAAPSSRIFTAPEAGRKHLSEAAE